MVQITLLKDDKINGINHKKGEKISVSCKVAKKLLENKSIKKPKGE